MSKQMATAPIIEANGLRHETKKPAKAAKSAQMEKTPKGKIRHSANPVAEVAPLTGTEAMSRAWQQLYREISKGIRP